METNQNSLETINLENYGNEPKTLKTHETTLKNHGNQPKTMKNQPNRPPLIQKNRYVTDAGSQLTSFDPKTLRQEHGDPTDLL